MQITNFAHHLPLDLTETFLTFLDQSDVKFQFRALFFNKITTEISSELFEGQFSFILDGFGSKLGKFSSRNTALVFRGRFHQFRLRNTLVMFSRLTTPFPSLFSIYRLLHASVISAAIPSLSVTRLLRHHYPILLRL